MLGKNYWFVSHCSKDVYVVNQLVNILKACNISYWKAPEMIPAGSNYAREIPKALNSCAVVLLVLSEASQNSIWVEKEVDIALNCRKKIIPIKIDSTPLSDMYRFYLNNVQTIDISVPPSGQLPMETQRKLRSAFLQHITPNDDWKKDTRELSFGNNQSKTDEESKIDIPEKSEENKINAPKENIESSVDIPKTNIENRVSTPKANVESKYNSQKVNIENKVNPQKANVGNKANPKKANVENKPNSQKTNIENKKNSSKTNITTKGNISKTNQKNKAPTSQSNKLIKLQRKR